MKFASEMCYDVQETRQSMSTSVASVNTRDMVFTPDHHNTYPKIDIPEEFRIDTKPFVNRPFFVENVIWSNEPKYKFLTTNTKMLPRDIFTSNPSLEMALKLGAYFRSDLNLNVSIAGTISHAGTLLVGILPPMPSDLQSTNINKFLINTIMSGPHCFLHANEATSAVLHVPWYCNTDLASLDMRMTNPGFSTAICETTFPGNFATLVVMVLNPLSPSVGSSSSLNLVIEACFSNLDIFVPSPKFLTYLTQGSQVKYESQGLQQIASTAIDATTSYVKGVVGDAIDMAREGVRYYTGLHNPNIPLINNRMIVTSRNFGNNTTGEQFFEKLDPYPEIDRIVDRPIFNTSVDEMSIKHIISKPQYLGTFRVNANDTTGQLLWTKPISPKQGGLDQSSVCIANNIELIHYLSRAWRGSINIHIQSVMNNKQQIKLRLIQLYNPPTEATVATPIYPSLLSAPSHLMEFTGGGQIHTVNLPYLCRNQLTPCSPDLNFEALFHGLYYIFLAQPLVVSSDSPLEVNFNVFISAGDDLSFHGYATQPGTITPLISSTAPSLDTVSEIIKLLQNTEPEIYTTQGITVMNEPQLNKELTSYSTGIDLEVPHQERLYSPIDIRPIIRRMYPSATVALPTGATIINLDKLLAEKTELNVTVNPLQMVASMYYGKSAGLKIKLKIYDPGSHAQAYVMYVPPQFNVNTIQSTIRACKTNPTTDYDPNNYNNCGYPLPFVELPQINAEKGGGVFEFVVPNTNFYKFVGGPEKFYLGDPNLSIAGVGNLLVWNTSGTKMVIHAGCTDESRFGFHCIAPIVRPIVKQLGDTLVNSGIYVGSSGGSATDPCAVYLNPNVYYARS